MVHLSKTVQIKSGIVQIYEKYKAVSVFRSMYKVKVKVSHSLTAVGAVGVRVPLYLGQS